MEDLFEDSDTEYAQIEVPKNNVPTSSLHDKVKSPPKKRVLASPRISKQLSKNGTSGLCYKSDI